MDISKSSHHYFHAFCVRPSIHFETQESGEQVILVLRAHPITLLSWIINAIILAILLFFLNFVLVQFLSPTQILFIDIFGIAMILAYLWFNFLNWFFNVGIVTDKKIVDVDFHAIIYKEVNYTQLNHVEDVTAKSAGYLSSLFNFGNIFIQTAGTEINLEFLKVPKPSQVAKIINSLVSKK